MSSFQERLKQLDRQSQDREQRERSNTASSEAQARENQPGISANQALVTRITAELSKTAASVRSSFSESRAPIWNENVGEDAAGGFFIIPGPTGPLGEVAISLIPLAASVKCTVAATRRNKDVAALTTSHDFTTRHAGTREADVREWVETVLPDAFAVFYAT